jgi:UDP-2,4-diacetamido-2,4,6-trideoxy-beta-L-altropyranose hydrolase
VTALDLREATAADADLLREWRNDPDVRRNSFDQRVVEEAAHRRWLAVKLAARGRTRIWILTEDGVPAGQIRYDVDGAAAQISFSIGARFRGRGLGTAIVQLSAPRACRELGVRELRAFVKEMNVASIAAFIRAGFRREADTLVDGDAAAVFVRTCE